MTTPRNAPCPCGSGIKYKKCCLRRDEERRLASTERLVVGERRNFVTSARGRLEHLPDAHAWPVRRVSVPVPDVWCATGMGTVAIVRQRPDGRLAYAAFTLNLSEHGITAVMGESDAPAGAEDSLLDDMADLIPPMQEGSIADAAAFVYSALALADEQGAGFPPDEIAPYLDLLPSPTGDARQWLDALIGPGGRTPAGLLRIIADLPVDTNVDDGKDFAVATEMAFRLPGASVASENPKFRRIESSDAVRVFDYTPVPSGTGLRSGTPGKIQGEVRMRGDRVEALAFVLSMAARLIADLREWLGCDIRLTSVRWTSSVTGRSEHAIVESSPSLSDGQSITASLPTPRADAE